MTDSPSGPINFTTARNLPSGQHPPLPGTLWSVSLWDGTRPLVIIPLEVMEDTGQRIIFKGATPVIAAVFGIIRAMKYHAPNGEEYGPFPCGHLADAKSLPAGTFLRGNTVVTPGNTLTFGGASLTWTATS
jgi:hypothetical protein